MTLTKSQERLFIFRKLARKMKGNKFDGALLCTTFEDALKTGKTIKVIPWDCEAITILKEFCDFYNETATRFLFKDIPKGRHRIKVEDLSPEMQERLKEVEVMLKLDYGR